MDNKGKLMILYDWFYPGFRAGGPIQSLTNLAVELCNEFDIYVITGANDLNATERYANISIDAWTNVLLPGSSNDIKVFYADKARLNKETLTALIKQINPSIIYINGIFSYQFFLLPLLVSRKASTALKIVVCPRGMLKKGALSSKWLKKKIYLTYLKYSRLLHKVYWHATTENEAVNIVKHFPVNSGVLVAPNIPRRPMKDWRHFNKNVGELKLVYLSLINEHKNLLLLLQTIKENESNVLLDVYGPIIDSKYWEQCHILINQMPEKVQYKGEVEPAMVQSVLSCYHALILLTKGENFGHAIYESFSAGRPALISYYTPWQDLYLKKAGVNIDIKQVEDCWNKIKIFLQMDDREYKKFCLGAYKMSVEYFESVSGKQNYKRLFSS